MSDQLNHSEKPSPGEFICGALELLLDPETIVFGLLAFLVLGVYAIAQQILEAFPAARPKACLDDCYGFFPSTHSGLKCVFASHFTGSIIDLIACSI
jgi:hypothetical protein